MNVNGLSAIVTGGASGLGEATARMLASRGARVAIFDVDANGGPLVAGQIGGLFIKVDVTSEDSVIRGLDSAERANGPLRILVNCAGIVVGQKTTDRNEAHSLTDFQRVVTINLVGTFNCIRLAASRMTCLSAVNAEERGVIVNTASIAAFDGQIGQAAYSASKAGIVGMTLPIARDLARYGVRVMTIAPGIFKTPMLFRLPQRVQDSLGQSTPFPSRLGEPEEYASLVCYICENAMLNGETIRLDGAIRLAPR
jgi:NAD(P)-dependent dehydrogenase (short-subunit alcohol dehydrogenase family)